MQLNKQNKQRIYIYIYEVETNEISNFRVYIINEKTYA